MRKNLLIRFSIIGALIMLVSLICAKYWRGSTPVGPHINQAFSSLVKGKPSVYIYSDGAGVPEEKSEWEKLTRLGKTQGIQVKGASLLQEMVGTLRCAKEAHYGVPEDSKFIIYIQIPDGTLSPRWEGFTYRTFAYMRGAHGSYLLPFDGINIRGNDSSSSEGEPYFQIQPRIGRRFEDFVTRLAIQARGKGVHPHVVLRQQPHE